MRGSLFGLAFGDALGAETEFLSVEEITAKWPPDGPRALSPAMCRVTDDTQMAIAVARALIAAKSLGRLDAATLETRLRSAFVEWLHDPENDRAPGMTCIASCSALAYGRPWVEATARGSKGCGANMRVTPVALLDVPSDELSDRDRAALAQFQAALTHGHPTALAASDLTAFTVRYLLQSGSPDALPHTLREYAQSQRYIYHQDWLGTLWQRPGTGSPEEFISRGWGECIQVLDRLGEGLSASVREIDPCIVTGEGWIAEEAFATGLLCFLLFPDDPPAAIHRAAVSSGDSDSIACLTGAFAGAHMGSSAWPGEWYEVIEYGEQLKTLSITLAG